MTVKEQQEWKIPPCISNWKNQKVRFENYMYSAINTTVESSSVRVKIWIKLLYMFPTHSNYFHICNNGNIYNDKEIHIVHRYG